MANKNKVSCVILMACSLMMGLAGCGDSGGDRPEPAPEVAPRSPGMDDTPEEPARAAREMMTLGSRQQASRPVQVETSDDRQWQPYERAPEFTHLVSLPDQLITLSDGTQLFAKVTLPGFSDAEPAPGDFPVVLTQTSYNTSMGGFVPEIGGANEFLVTRGYAHVVVDVRGTGNSGGNWEAFGEREQQDYLEVVEWLVQQPWAQDRIGVEGISYLGITAILTAQQNHPAVKAAFPVVPIGDGYRDIVFTGGNVNATFIPMWMGLVTGLGALPLELAPEDPFAFLQAFPERLFGAALDFQLPIILGALLGDPQTAYDEEFWAVRSPLEGADKVNVPTFVVGGLFDLFQRSEPLWFEQLTGRVDTKLLIGPWNHIQAAGIPDDGLPADGVPDLNTLRLQWFDEYVMGLETGVQDQPDVTQYVLGLDRYETTSHWPHPDMVAQRYYLSGQRETFPGIGVLQMELPEESGQQSTIQYPVNGLCSFSLNQWTAGFVGLLPIPCVEDNRYSELEALKFELPAGDDGLYLNGPMQADLWVSTTALDVQLSVRLDIVNPDGTTTPVTNGLLTASMNSVDESRSRYVNGEMIQPWHTYREADTRQHAPGEIRKVSVEIFPSSAFVPPGSSLTVSVNTSNMAQGIPPLLTTIKSALGMMTLHTGPETPSSVVLPVVPAASL